MCEIMKRQPVVPPIHSTHTVPHTIGNYSQKIRLPFLNDGIKKGDPDHTRSPFRII